MQISPRWRPSVARRRHGGNAVLEMALVLPLLLFLAMGLVELGDYFYLKMAFAAAARDAARMGIRAVAATGDPAAAATATLGQSNVTFSAAWMQIYDENNATTVTDVATIPAGHPLKFYIGTTVGSVPASCRPLNAMTGQGIGSGKVLWGECTMVKE